MDIIQIKDKRFKTFIRNQPGFGGCQSAFSQRVKRLFHVYSRSDEASYDAL